MKKVKIILKIVLGIIIVLFLLFWISVCIFYMFAPSIAEFVIKNTKNDSDTTNVSDAYNFTDNGTHNGTIVTVTTTTRTLEPNETENLTLSNYLKWLWGEKLGVI